MYNTMYIARKPIIIDYGCTAVKAELHLFYYIFESKAKAPDTFTVK